MLVDDDLDTLQMLTIALEQAGGEVRACASATEALDMLAGWKADLLVSDIGMPNEDGYALIRKVRALEPELGGAMPAIALTAFAGVADRSRALSAGFQKHVSKPVEPLDLVRIIARLAGDPSGDAAEESQST
jgi:CheY-like chemotaxis protein